jgi:uncharacterized OB-fold protein
MGAGPAKSRALKYVLREMGRAAREFYRRLEEGELATSFCDRCGRLWFPPRERCPACAGPMGWRQLSGRGAVYAFTSQERGLRFTAPTVLGIVELEEGVRLFGMFEAAAFETLSIGQPVDAHPVKDEWGLTLIAFRPRQ